MIKAEDATKLAKEIEEKMKRTDFIIYYRDEYKVGIIGEGNLIKYVTPESYLRAAS